MSSYDYDRNLEKVEAAQERIQEAIEELAVIIVSEDPGFNERYLEKIESAQQLLLQARRKLKQ